MLNSIHWLIGGWGRVGSVLLEARQPRTLSHKPGTQNQLRHVISTSTSAIGLQAKYFLPLLPGWNICSRLLKLMEKLSGLLQKWSHANRLPHSQIFGHDFWWPWGKQISKDTHGEIYHLWFSRSVHCKQGDNPYAESTNQVFKNKQKPIGDGGGGEEDPNSSLVEGTLPYMYVKHWYNQGPHLV